MESEAASSAAAKAAFIESSQVFFLGHALARRLAPAAKRTPVDGFGNYTFVGTYRRMRDARARRADRWLSVLEVARRLHHQPAERRDRDVARAKPLDRAVADRPHAFPHRDVLVRDARNAGEVAGLHGGPILEVIVLPRADAVEVLV